MASLERSVEEPLLPLNPKRESLALKASTTLATKSISGFASSVPSHPFKIRFGLSVATFWTTASLFGSLGSLGPGVGYVPGASPVAVSGVVVPNPGKLTVLVTKSGLIVYKIK